MKTGMWTKGLLAVLLCAAMLVGFVPFGGLMLANAAGLGNTGCAPRIEIDGDWTRHATVYCSRFTFTATAEDAPEGAVIRWYVNDAPAAEGSACEMKQIDRNFTLQARLFDANGKLLARSEEMDVTANGLFASILNYFLTALQKAIAICVLPAGM